MTTESNEFRQGYQKAIEDIEMAIRESSSYYDGIIEAMKWCANNTVHTFCRYTFEDAVSTLVRTGVLFGKR